jgi:hypothetical protein
LIVTTKSYADQKKAIAAAKRAGLAALPIKAVIYDAAGSKGWTALVSVQTNEDADEVRARGFMAEVR